MFGVSDYSCGVASSGDRSPGAQEHMVTGTYVCLTIHTNNSIDNCTASMYAGIIILYEE